MNGGTMLLSNHEGIPPLPLEVDDEALTLSGVPQGTSPAQGLSDTPSFTYISGFVAVVQIFRIIGEVQTRHHTLINDPSSSQDALTLILWIDKTVERLRNITEELPLGLRARPATGTGHSGPPSVTSFSQAFSGKTDMDATAGIQQANIVITALCAEFALVSLTVLLTSTADTICSSISVLPCIPRRISGLKGK